MKQLIHNYKCSQLFQVHKFPNDTGKTKTKRAQLTIKSLHETRFGEIQVSIYTKNR